MGNRNRGGGVTYQEARDRAKDMARVLEETYVVHCWAGSNELGIPDSIDYTSLDSFVNLGKPNAPTYIMATVDKDGKVTESRWVKEQMGVAA